MKRPLLVVALLYAGGIVAGKFLPASLPLLFFVSFLLAGSALAAKRFNGVLLALAVSLLGWTHFLTRTVPVSPHDLRITVGTNAVYATVRGTLAHRPVLRLSEQQGSTRSRMACELVAYELSRGGGFEPAHGRVVILTPGKLEGFHPGDEVEITGVLAPPAGPQAPGLFDYRSHLRSRGVHYQLKTEGAADWKHLGDARASPPFADGFQDWARTCLARGLSEEDEAVRLLWAMALGWRTALTGEVSEPFMRSGTLHVFAISGLHVGLICGILVYLLRFARVPRLGCALIVVPALWFYAAATGWQPSAVRATVMASVIAAGWALHRPADLLNSLGGAALLILLWSPLQLFQAGFQLSFAVVCSIALFMPHLERVQQKLLQPDPLLPPELRPAWQRHLDSPIRWLTGSATVSLAAWIGSFPLIAHYFHLVTPVSLLANLVIVPLSAVALMSVMGSLLCGVLLPPVSEIYNHTAWFSMKCMIEFSRWAASWPRMHAHFSLGGGQVVTAYVMIGLAFSAIAGRREFRKIAALACAALGAGWFAFAHADNSDATITVLPLGGAGIYVEGKANRENLLIDCGSESSSAFFTKPFLLARSVNRIPTLVLTHGDVQHVGGWRLLNSMFHVDEVVTSAVSQRSSVYRQVLREIEETGQAHRRAGRGETIAGWEILHPAASDKFTNADDAALVLRRNYGGVRILLLSDLGRGGQRLLLEREEDLGADLVIAGMPNKDEPLGDMLLAAIEPKVIVIACAEYPAGARSGRALRGRLEQSPAPVLYTSDLGAVTVRIERGEWRIYGTDGALLLPDQR